MSDPIHTLGIKLNKNVFWLYIRDRRILVSVDGDSLRRNGKICLRLRLRLRYVNFLTPSPSPSPSPIFLDSVSVSVSETQKFCLRLRLRLRDTKVLSPLPSPSPRLINFVSVSVSVYNNLKPFYLVQKVNFFKNKFSKLMEVQSGSTVRSFYFMFNF